MGYDADGLRSSKTVAGVKTTYQYVGDKLFYENRGNGDSFYYFYDCYGKLAALYHNRNGTKVAYHVVTNSQGDVIALYSWTGTKVAEYSYDAWGNCTIVSDTSSTGIATLNPFRYRGYYYDTDLGLYYLQSRYYDATIGRFINADGYVTTGQGVMSYNMYAYCQNNPVMFSDPNGERARNIIKSIGKVITDVLASIFGASYSTTSTIAEFEEDIIPAPSPITISTGSSVTQTLTESGDSSKFLSVYADSNVENPILSSSVGIKLNIKSLSLDTSLAIDDFGVSISHSKDNTTNSFAIKGDITNLKVGFEYSNSINWDNTTETTYTNVSLYIPTIVALYYKSKYEESNPSYVPVCS